MTLEERHDVRVVLRALQASVTQKAVGKPEQRGNDYGPPEWHDGIELWWRALVIADADPVAFDAAWAGLVEQASTWVSMHDQ